MALYGAMTKRDLSGIGRAAIGLLIGVIVATLINFFLQSPAVDYLLSYLTVAIFLGLTAYDNQQIRNLYFATAGQDNTGFAAFMALQLYLDFINLFLSFLRIFFLEIKRSLTFRCSEKTSLFIRSVFFNNR